ncbi:MAG: sugar transferase [Saprospiraceae bacterium]
MSINKSGSSYISKWQAGYVIVDGISAILSWLLFFIYRKINEVPDDYFEWAKVWEDSILYLGLSIIPCLWILLYYGADQYNKIFRQSRITILFRTLIQSLIGSFVLLLTVLVDDDLLKYESYLTAFLVLLIVHFCITFLLRLALLSFLKRKMKNGDVAFNTVIVGTGKTAQSLAKELERFPSWGYHLLGFVTNKKTDLKKTLGNLQSLSQVVFDNDVREVIFCLEKRNSEAMQLFLNQIYPFHNRVQINITTHHKETLGKIHMRPIRGAEMIAIDIPKLPNWEMMIKRILDVIVSAVLLIILLPVVIWLAIKIKYSSAGPLFYFQDRIGYKGAKFRIVKFRTMYKDAEINGPQLSFDGDDRCTPFGAFIRKWRLDEIPQFWNVIKGDMSLVGPRPEREYFIDQLKVSVPRYNYLLSVRPGITSLGQVKYGYASDLEQMLKRLKFDLLYLDNRSLGLDIKILFYTILVLLEGKGK